VPPMEQPAQAPAKPLPDSPPVLNAGGETGDGKS
jgi:hypothetical protein